MTTVATETRLPPPLGPVKERERIVALDVLRGFALLGIFMVNMQFFAMPFGELISPDFYDGASIGDVLAWGFVKAFFEYKFISLFSLLFGAGLIIQMTRAEARGRRFVPLYLRRLLVLAVIGLVHGFGLWYGDILFVYACAGLVVFLCRRWRPKTMLIIAGAIVGFFSGVQLLAAVGIFIWSVWFSGGESATAEEAAVAEVAEPSTATPVPDGSLVKSLLCI